MKQLKSEHRFLLLLKNGDESQSNSDICIDACEHLKAFIGFGYSIPGVLRKYLGTNRCECSETCGSRYAYSTEGNMLHDLTSLLSDKLLASLSKSQ